MADTAAIPPWGPDSQTGTYLYRLIEKHLTDKTEWTSLRAYLDDARSREMTFMAMAEELRNTTGQYVTNESIRRWYRDIEASAPS